MVANSSIRFLFFADTHLGFDYPVRPRKDRRRRGQDFFDNFQRILDRARERRADFVVHGGDFFFRSKVPRKIVDLAYKALFEFTESGIDFYIVPGNHERARLPDSILLSHPRIRIFDKPKTYTLRFNGKVLALSGFPFVRENIRARFPDILEETGWRTIPAQIRMLCMHQAVEGAQVGPRDYTFRSGDDVIRIDDIPDGFLAVLAGHIHRRQILRKRSSRATVPVIYPGSIERTSFAEKTEKKGFYEIELSLPLTAGHEILRIEFINLPARPMVDLFLDGDVDEQSLTSFLSARIRDIHPDAIVRLKVDGRLNPQVAERLTSAYLRSLFPESMNVELGSYFSRIRKEGQGDAD